MGERKRVKNCVAEKTKNPGKVKLYSTEVSNEKLEPTGQSILNICGAKTQPVTKPKIGEFKASDTLARVKDFLPKLEKANSELTEKDNLEDVSKDSKYVEMNILECANPDNWSADS